MNCDSIKFSRHAFERMFQRSIDPDAVQYIVTEGETIGDYPDDRPFPSALLLGFHAGEPLHIVVARDPHNGECHIITVYRPDPGIWDETYQFRRNP
ncbi:MAG: DUF4258 domain-containing protein [Methylococcales bacterium]